LGKSGSNSAFQIRESGALKTSEGKEVDLIAMGEVLKKGIYGRQCDMKKTDREQVHATPIMPGRGILLYRRGSGWPGNNS